MPRAKDADKYPEARNVLDKALQTDNGLVLEFDTWRRAFSFMHQLYTVRKRDRQTSRQIYDPHDPAWGRSLYDHLKFRLRPTQPEVKAQPELKEQPASLELTFEDLSGISMKDPLTGEKIE